MKKKIKIIRISTKPRVLSRLLEGQLKYINKFLDVIAISSPAKELNDLKVKEGVQTISLNMERQISPIKDLVSLVKLILILKKEKPDIIHSHTPKAGFISMIASFICRVPNRLHTVAGLPLVEIFGFKKRLLLFVEWLTYKCSTKVYCNSKNLRKFILKNISIPKNKISVIGAGSSNGIDTEYFKRTHKLNKLGNNFIKSHNLKNNFLFIFIGRIVKEKGIEELIQAFCKLNENYNNIKLIILGREGDEEKKLDPISSRIKKIIISNKNIINIGYKEDIRPYLITSNCLILPTYREGFPNVVLQARCMQVPCIVTDINGCNEIVSHNINGLLIKPKDINSLYRAMKKLFLEKKLYKALSKNSREDIVLNYNRLGFHKKIFNEYKTLIN